MWDEDPGPSHFVWTRSLQDDLRQQCKRACSLRQGFTDKGTLIIAVEHLVILDFLMRNTDRGLDNFMLKVSRNGEVKHEPQTPNDTITSQPMGAPDMSQTPSARNVRKAKSMAQLSDQSHTHVLAIDNSLAFPQHHPRGWRSFAYGWLWLPVSMIGLPWSQETRQHFLSLLTDKAWWQETSESLRQTFSKDPDFNNAQFSKQLALVKVSGIYTPYKECNLIVICRAKD